MNYQEFLAKKEFKSVSAGFDADLSQYPLFEYQQDIVKWACNRGRAAIFADTGMGKTIMQLSWADQVAQESGGKVLVLAPLAVREQTIEEGSRFGISCGPGTDIHVINYEQLHNIEAEDYAGVVLDESSILKGMNGKIRKQITGSFKQTPYRLSCTATPSPNDFMELGTQSEFLGIMSQVEMLAMFFIHDGSDTSKWRLKGHGKRKFFEWLATWSVFISKPSDLGYSDEGHELPSLVFHEHVIESGITDGLFAPIAQGLLDRNRARKDTVDARVEEAAMIANGIKGQCLVWCHLNDESEKLTAMIDGSVEVTGSDDPDRKASNMLSFAKGGVKKLVTKPKIAGFGMNWQGCNHMVFVGLSDSWEQFYQAVRRCWRYGQDKTVHVHIVSADVEGGVLANIKRKESQNKQLKAEMIAIMKNRTLQEIGRAVQEKTEYKRDVEMILPAWLVSVAPDEQWREIFDGYYAVSNYGRVKRLAGGKGARVGLLAQPRDKAGYPMTSICIGGKRKAVRTHCLVAEQFIGPRPEGMQVNHKDGNKANNQITNLEYVTHSENGKHAWATGLQPKRRVGEKA